MIKMPCYPSQTLTLQSTTEPITAVPTAETEDRWSERLIGRWTVSQHSKTNVVDGTIFIPPRPMCV